MIINAKFEKVSKERFVHDINQWAKSCGWEANQQAVVYGYHQLQLPKRSTVGSAGYDFHAPFEFTLQPGETLQIYTGVRCEIPDGWFLAIFPRSGMSNRTKMRLDNTVGIVDCDYFEAENEGHIMVQITTEKPLHINAGERFCQGIFIPYGVTIDDDADKTRTGGFGSTGKV